MCVPIEHPFPSINPARTGTGPCGGGPPHGPVAPLQPSVLARRRGGVGAEQEVDVRVGRHRGELLARRPCVPRVSVAPPEHRLHALGRRRPPVVARDGPQLRVHPSLDHVVGRRQRAGLGQGGGEVGEQRPRRHLVAVSSHLTVVDAPRAVRLHRRDPDEVLPLRLARPPQ